MDKHAWDRFTRKIDVKADPQAIYDAWTIPAQLETWFLRQALFTEPDSGPRLPNTSVQPGDTYLWRWYGYNDDVKEEGEVLEANGHDRFKFTFGKAGVVTVEIKPEEDVQMVSVTQEEIPFSETPEKSFFVDCSVGWTLYLANLKSLLEGGIDLRNKNEKIKGVVNS